MFPHTIWKALIKQPLEIAGEPAQSIEGLEDFEGKLRKEREAGATSAEGCVLLRSRRLRYASNYPDGIILSEQG